MGGTWRVVILGLAVAGMALAYLANALVQRAGVSVDIYVALAVAGLGILALWWVFSRLVRHFRDVERLGVDLAALRHRNELSTDWELRGDELGRLGAALAELLRRERRTGGGGRLGAVAAALEEPLLVLGGNGRIGLLNPAATRLFGPGVAVGMDIYDLFDRPDLFRAIERARGAGQPVAAVLRGPDGAEFPAQVADLGLQVGVALVFPFRPTAPPRLSGDAAAASAAPGVDEQEPLGALPVMALWVATAVGRVISVGTMRLSGARIFRTVSLDVPVNPGEPVPATAFAAHGLTAEEMTGARPFVGAWPVIAEALRDCVVVGVDVDAALAALRAELERAGLPPLEEPPTLDLRRVAAALDPASAGLDLPGLAARFGVGQGRGQGGGGAPHALLTAELAATLIRRLDERGTATFGAARALTGGAAAALPPG